MKCLNQTALALSVAVLMLTAGPSHAQTAGEMLHACETLQRGERIEGNAVLLPPGKDAQQCWGFMSAVQEYSVLADENGQRLLGACPASATKTTQIVDAFVKYTKAHPEKLNMPAAAVAYGAMAAAFPCPSE